MSFSGWFIRDKFYRTLDEKMKSPETFIPRTVWIGAVLGLLMLGFVLFRFAFPERSAQSNREPLPATNLPVAAIPAKSTNALSVTTAGDGRDTNSIRRWAHNELEVQRMLAENDKIYRRQLVVLKEPVAVIVERNRLTGESIRELTLPGLDGQEISFSVQRADIEPSGLRGMFYGQVTGRPDSMVTLAFKNRVQAFTVISPTDNLYLDAEPHDPGDVIVKSINLEKYGAGLCGVK